MTDFENNRSGFTKNVFATLATPKRPYPDWALPADEAVNFTAGSVARVELPAGSLLYRVWGGPAHKKGAYWSPDKPQETTEGAWRSRNAVEPWWNAGTDLVTARVEPGHSIHVWSGGITTQPALYANNDIMQGYFLEGGGRQCFVQHWLPEFKDAFKIVEETKTPWDVSEDAEDHPPANARPERDTSALDIDDPVQRVAIHLFQCGAAMRRLARVTRDAKASEQKDAGDSAEMTANNMITQANAILRALPTDPQGARDIAKRAAGLRRVAEIDTEMFGGATARQARQADDLLSVTVTSAALVLEDG